MAKRQIRRAQALRSFSGDSAPTLELTRPRQESNLRTRLRRPALSPLSYGGMIRAWNPPNSPSKPLRGLRSTQVASLRHMPILLPVDGSGSLYERGFSQGALSRNLAAGVELHTRCGSYPLLQHLACRVRARQAFFSFGVREKIPAVFGRFR